ncbi:MAG: hypothetical protein IPP88_20580 [Betaproteobacteria bacterium]|nr:hypothetical protein [Betaproteobacteria bacterium]
MLIRIHRLHEERENELQKKREEIEFVIRGKRVQFAQEIIARQHLCFFEFGDAEAYRKGFARLREKYERDSEGCSRPVPAGFN